MLLAFVVPATRFSVNERSEEGTNLSLLGSDIIWHDYSSFIAHSSSHLQRLSAPFRMRASDRKYRSNGDTGRADRTLKDAAASMWMQETLLFCSLDD